MTTAYIGKPTSRVDGRAKVTGQAKYAAEHNIPDLVYGYVVSSAVARGKITRIDAADALELPGVLHVFTHENTPRLARSDRTSPPAGAMVRVLARWARSGNCPLSGNDSWYRRLDLGNDVSGNPACFSVLVTTRASNVPAGTFTFWMPTTFDVPVTP